jgi:hypothetical protein
MKLTNNARKMLVNEINFVTKKMMESSAPHERLFYFSAIYGLIHRILNQEFDPDLVHVHFVLRSLHQSFTLSLKALKSEDSMPLINDFHFERLNAFTIELGDQIKNKKSITETIKKFVILIYSTTGNGFYLLQKGVLKI